MRDFYPFVEEHNHSDHELVLQPARIAIYDDVAAAPRVVVVEANNVREYLEQVTSSVTKLSHDAGGTIPFMVIREIVENFIHAGFESPTITILDKGNTLRFSDKGPGIQEKNRALEYGTSSATEEMKLYIRGVGSGLPYAQQYMADHGGSLTIEDNISGGCVVTISTRPSQDAYDISRPQQPHETSETSMPLAQNFDPYGNLSSLQGDQSAQMTGYPYQAVQPYAQPFNIQPQIAVHEGQLSVQHPYGVPAYHPIYNSHPTVSQGVVSGFYQQNQQAQGSAQEQVYSSDAAAPSYQQPTGYTTRQPYPVAEEHHNNLMNSSHTALTSPMSNQTTYAVHTPPMQPHQEHVHPTMTGASYDSLTSAPTQRDVFMSPAQTSMRPALFDDIRYQEVFALFAHVAAIGPQDLVINYGKSAPTWSRILKELTEQGVVIKRGQKYYLTNLGKSYLSSH